jgi:hypothetical protein
MRRGLAGPWSRTAAVLLLCCSACNRQAGPSVTDARTAPVPAPSESAPARDVQIIEQPAVSEPQGLYYYHAGERVALQPDLTRIAAVFESMPSPQEMQRLVDEEPLMGAELVKTFPEKNLAVFELPNGSMPELQELAAWAERNPQVVAVNPLYLAGSRELIVTRQFMAEPDPEADPAEIATLHERWGVRVLERIEALGLELLEVGSAEPNRTIEIANRYQESGLYLGAWPDFLTEIVPRGPQGLRPM